MLKKKRPKIAKSAKIAKRMALAKNDQQMTKVAKKWPNMASVTPLPNLLRILLHFLAHFGTLFEIFRGFEIFRDFSKKFKIFRAVKSCQGSKPNLASKTWPPALGSRPPPLPAHSTDPPWTRGTAFLEKKKPDPHSPVRRNCLAGFFTGCKKAAGAGDCPPVPAGPVAP